MKAASDATFRWWRANRDSLRGEKEEGRVRITLDDTQFNFALNDELTRA